MAEVRKSEGYTLLVLEIFIIILNILAIIVILRFKKKYNPDILIFTLAVADLLKAFIPLNMTLVAYLKGKAMTEGSLSCNIFGWTAFTLNSVIMLVMTVMAIDRYVAICWPFRYKHFLSKKRLIYTIIAVFAFSGVHSMLPLTGVGRMRSYNNGSFCHFDFDSTIPECMGYSIFVLVLGISMLVVVIFCYTRAMFSVRGLIRRQRRMSTSTRDIDGADQKRQSMNHMFARLMIVMMMAFCLSWLLFLIVVLQHVSGWFQIAPEAHFWSMRLAVINSVFNPAIGAAMCRPYRRGYMFILCKCLHCFGLCSSYNAEDPWTRSRKLSVGSRNSSDRDQNEPNTNDTVKSKIWNNPSFNSYHDSGIVSDSNDPSGTLGYHQAGVFNAAYEMDGSLAGVTQHVSGVGRIKTRPRLNTKRISFKDEVEVKQIAGMPLYGKEAVEPMTIMHDDTTNPQQQDGISLQYSGAESGLKNTSAENQSTSMSAPTGGIDRMIIAGSDEKRRRKYGFADVHLSTFNTLEPSSLVRQTGHNELRRTSKGEATTLKEGDHLAEGITKHGIKSPLEIDNNSQLVSSNGEAAADTLPKGSISDESVLNLSERQKPLTRDKSEQYHLTSSKDNHTQIQEQSYFHTVQITHFPVATDSDIKTIAVKSPVLTNIQRSKSAHAFSPFSLRSSSFIERTLITSPGGQKPRSRSLANDFSASDVDSVNSMVNSPENTARIRHDSYERQHSIHPTTPSRAHGAGALFDTQRFNSEEALLSEFCPSLSRTKGFESVLCNPYCKSDSTAYSGVDLPPFQSHPSAHKWEQLKGTHSEPDLTRTLPETVFQASPCRSPDAMYNGNLMPGVQRGSFISGPHSEDYKENMNSHQRRASSPQIMPLSARKIYKQLSELSQKDLEREVFC